VLRRRRWYIVPRALAKRSGKPGRRADGYRATPAQPTEGDLRQRQTQIREAPGRPSTPRPVPGASPLARAQIAMRSGDFRTARSLAAEVAAQGDDKEREQARRILASISPDRAALIAAACVLVVIALAAILALFRAR